MVTNAGTYSVTRTDANGCSASDSMVIDVFNVDISQNDTTICEGDSLVILANGSQTYPSGSNNSQLSGTLNNDLVAYYPFNLMLMMKAEMEMMELLMEFFSNWSRWNSKFCI